MHIQSIYHRQLLFIWRHMFTMWEIFPYIVVALHKNIALKRKKISPFFCCRVYKADVKGAVLMSSKKQTHK